jgi:hypothetical protein
VQRRIRQFDLRLETLGTCHLKLRYGGGGVGQECGLADPRLATHNESPAAPGPDVGEQPIQDLDLLSTAS